MIYNGVDVRYIHPAVSVSKEIPPGMPRREVGTVQGSDGETVAGVTITQDEYTVEVNIACRNKLDAWRVRALLAQWATSSGDKTAELLPTHWPGVAYDAIAGEISPPRFKFGFAMVEVTFILPRPIAHDLAYTPVSGAPPLTIGIGGSAPCRPVIAQTMGAAHDGLTWALDGTTMMRITGDVAAGQVIEADFARGSLTIDGVHAEARIDYTVSRWYPGFTPGAHRMESSDGGNMRIRWRCEWV